MSFQINALPGARFAPLFEMSDKELEKLRAVRMLVNAKPGYPCRVSLQDAEPGESVILLNYMHKVGHSPFQSTHAIYVRENASQSFPRVGTIPNMLKTRLISVRAFDDRHYIVCADVVDGRRLIDTVPEFLADPSVSYLHLHNARLGCFLAAVSRA